MIWTAFTLLLLVAIVTDARSYRIPNWISIALVALFVPAAALSGQPFMSYWPHLAAAAVMFGLCFLLYMFTAMAAGDAKLATAITLWTGVSGLYAWMLALGVAMAMLAISLIVLRRALPASVGNGIKVFQKGAPVPLGIALGLAAIVASASFNPALWAF